MLHLPEAVIQCIVQRRSAADADAAQCGSESVTIVGEVLPQFGSVGECHQENVVVPVNCPDELFYCTCSGSNLPDHAAACIQKNSHTDGQVIGLREVGDFLRFPIFFDDQIVLGKIRNVVPCCVRDGRDYVDQCNVNLQLGRNHRNGQQSSN